MKFLTFTVAALAGWTDASSRLSGKSTNNKKFTTKLMKNAKPYGTSNTDGSPRRHLEEENQISGLHSVIFKSCETLSVQADFDNEDGGDDDGSYTLQKLYGQGAIKPQQSYILFDTCLSEYCYTGDDSNRTTYVVDMATFVDAFAEFIPNKQADYCEACQENQNYCLYSNSTNNQDQDGNNDNRRQLEENQVYEKLDCNLCQSFGCFNNYNNNQNGNNNNNNNQNGDDQGENDGEENNYAVQWLEALAACEQSDDPYYYKNLEVSMGFMCNDDGTGVEIATFLDEDCVMYTNQVAFADVMSQQDYQYWSQSRQYIEYMFNTGFSCYDPEITYVTDDGYYQQQQNGNGNDNNQDNNEEDDQVPEAAEWCQMVFEGDMEPTPMNNCGGNNDEGGRKLDQDNNNDDGQSYTLAEDYIDNGYYVCQALNGFGGEGEHLYDKSGSGSMYQYSGTNQKSQNWGEHVQQQKNGSKANAGVIVFFVALVGAAMAIGGFMYYKKQKSSDNKKEPMLQMEEEKQGAMA